MKDEKLEDLFTLVHDLADESILKNLEYDKRKELQELQRQLTSQYNPPSPSDHSVANRQAILSQIENIESQLDFYRQMKQRKDSSPLSYHSPTNHRTGTDAPTKSLADEEEQLHCQLKTVSSRLQQDRNQTGEKRIRSRLKNHPIFSPHSTQASTVQRPTRTRNTGEMDGMDTYQYQATTAHPLESRPTRTKNTEEMDNIDTYQYQKSKSNPSRFRNSTTVTSQHEKSLHDAFEHQKIDTKNEIKQEQDRALNDLMIKMELDNEREIQLVRESYSLETNARRERLIQQLERDHVKARNQVEQDLALERETLLSSLQQSAEKEIQSLKEQQYQALLVEHETRLQEAVRKLQDQDAVQFDQEKAKVQMALELGEKQRLRQYTEQMKKHRQDRLRQFEEDQSAAYKKDLERKRKNYGDEEAKRMEELQYEHEARLNHEKQQYERQLSSELQQTIETERQQLQTKFDLRKQEWTKQKDAEMAEERTKLQTEWQREWQTKFQTFQSTLETTYIRRSCELIEEKEREAREQWHVQKQEMERESEQFWTTRQKPYVVSVYDQLVKSGAPASTPTGESISSSSRCPCRALESLAQIISSLSNEEEGDTETNNHLPPDQLERMHQLAEESCQEYTNLHQQYGVVLHRLGQVAQDYLEKERHERDQDRSMGVLRTKLHTLATRMKQQEMTCKRLVQENQQLVETINGKN